MVKTLSHADKHYFTKQQKQVNSITSLLNKEYFNLGNNPFHFESSEVAANHNSTIIQRHNYNLATTLEHSSKGTQLQPGSEFKPTEDLNLLLSDHTLWEKTKQILDYGCTIPLNKLDKKIEKLDLTKGLDRGNHKGALQQPKLLQELVDKDVQYGYALPITVETAK